MGSSLGALDEYGQDAYGTDLAEARMDMLLELEDVLKARRRDSWVVTYTPPATEAPIHPIWSTFGGEGGGERRSRSSSFDFSSAFMESLDAEHAIGAASAEEDNVAAGRRTQNQRRNSMDSVMSIPNAAAQPNHGNLMERGFRGISNIFGGVSSTLASEEVLPTTKLEKNQQQQPRNFDDPNGICVAKNANNTPKEENIDTRSKRQSVRDDQLMNVDFSAGDGRRKSVENIVGNDDCDDDESDGTFDTVSVANSNKQAIATETDTLKERRSDLMDKEKQRQTVRDEELLDVDFVSSFDVAAPASTTDQGGENINTNHHNSASWLQSTLSLDDEILDVSEGHFGSNIDAVAIEMGFDGDSSQDTGDEKTGKHLKRDQVSRKQRAPQAIGTKFASFLNDGGDGSGGTATAPTPGTDASRATASDFVRLHLLDNFEESSGYCFAQSILTAESPAAHNLEQPDNKSFCDGEHSDIGRRDTESMPAENLTPLTTGVPSTPRTPGGSAISLATGDLPPDAPMSPPTPTIGGGRKSPTSAAASFTADSPYFSSYVDKEMHSVNVLHDTVKDISARAKTFGKCGALMAEATRRLSQACRLQPSGASTSGGSDEGDQNRDKEKAAVDERRQAVGSEMESCLKILGGVSDYMQRHFLELSLFGNIYSHLLDQYYIRTLLTRKKVLDEIANAQMVMCESLEVSLSQTLEAFAGAEFQEAHRLRDEADVLTEAAEESFAKYLHGRHQERSNTEEQISKAMQVASTQFGAALKGFARSGSGVGSEDGGSGAGSAAPGTPRKHRSGGLRRSKSTNPDEDPAVAHAAAAANLRQNLEQIRLAQANAELKRFQLLKKLDSLKVSLVGSK